MVPVLPVVAGWLCAAECEGAACEGAAACAAGLGGAGVLLCWSEARAGTVINSNNSAAPCSVFSILFLEFIAASEMDL